jgi:hypothetical protein
VTGIAVEGLKETSAALLAAGAEVDDLKDVLGAVASEAADTMRGYVPVGSTLQRGRAHVRDTIRPNRAKGAAIVTIGGAKAPHAHVLRATHPSKFVEKTDAHMETRAVEILTDGWNEIAKRNGLST